MPSFTLAFWENRVRQDLVDADRSTVKKTAKLAKRRFDRLTHEPTDQEVLELYRTITYSDPVGDEVAACLDGHKACRNHEDHAPFHANAARRFAGHSQRKAATMPGDRLQQNPYQGELQ